MDSCFGILRFAMRNRRFQAVGEGIYLADNEQAHRAESAIYRAKLNPTARNARLGQSLFVPKDSLCLAVALA